MHARKKLKTNHIDVSTIVVKDSMFSPFMMKQIGLSSEVFKIGNNIFKLIINLAPAEVIIHIAKKCKSRQQLYTYILLCKGIQSRLYDSGDVQSRLTFISRIHIEKYFTDKLIIKHSYNHHKYDHKKDAQEYDDYRLEIYNNVRCHRYDKKTNEKIFITKCKIHSYEFKLESKSLGDCKVIFDKRIFCEISWIIYNDYALFLYFKKRHTIDNSYEKLYAKSIIVNRWHKHIALCVNYLIDYNIDYRILLDIFTMTSQYKNYITYSNKNDYDGLYSLYKDITISDMMRSILELDNVNYFKHMIALFPRLALYRYITKYPDTWRTSGNYQILEYVTQTYPKIGDLCKIQLELKFSVGNEKHLDACIRMGIQGVKDALLYAIDIGSYSEIMKLLKIERGNGFCISLIGIDEFFTLMEQEIIEILDVIYEMGYIVDFTWIVGAWAYHLSRLCGILVNKYKITINDQSLFEYDMVRNNDDIYLFIKQSTKLWNNELTQSIYEINTMFKPNHSIKRKNLESLRDVDRIHKIFNKRILPVPKGIDDNEHIDYETILNNPLDYDFVLPEYETDDSLDSQMNQTTSDGNEDDRDQHDRIEIELGSDDSSDILSIQI